MKISKIGVLATLGIASTALAGGASDFDTLTINSSQPGFNPSYYARALGQWDLISEGLRVFPADPVAQLYVTMSTLADSPVNFIYGSRWIAGAHADNPTNNPNMYGLSPDRSIAMDFYTTDGVTRLAAQEISFAVVDEGTNDQVGQTWHLLIYGLNDALLDTVTGNAQGITQVNYSRGQADIGRIVFVPSFDHEGMDSFRWSSVPTPGSAMLALTGLALLRRRR
ncbi:MAG: hypothetical protein IPM33_04265 [Phycisphaerales bacterium]|nr:hypothetical protein [Phycisphaerales bacterium]